jgi:hypothetical protein
MTGTFNVSDTAEHGGEPASVCTTAPYHHAPVADALVRVGGPLLVGPLGYTARAVNLSV